MRPYIFHIGDIGVPSFFFMVMIAALSATFFASWLAKREGADPVVMLDFGIIGIIASVIGARVFHILIENPSYYLEKPIRVFYFWQGGFVSLGAYTFTLIGWFIYLWKRKLETWRYLDLALMSAPIIIFFVRVGCLFVGCCYGKPTHFWLHLTFNDPGSVPALFNFRGMSLHATQIYFMLNAVVMWGVLYLVYRYLKFHGRVLAAFFIYYGATRFAIEFLRGDVDRGMWFGGTISSGQIAMIISFVGGIVLWILLSRRSTPPPL